VVRDIKPPKKVDEEKDIEWMCRSLSLFTNRDADMNAYKIFRALLQSSKNNEPVSSTILAGDLKLSRGTVLFHLQKFSQAGLITRVKGRKYTLRKTNLEETIEAMMKDIEGMFERIRKVASEIDKELGLDGRW